MSMEQLQKENDELRAHVERLREALTTANRILYDDCFTAAMPAKDYIELALTTYPAQSLRHIESRVEEETIERCVEQIRKKGDSSSYDMVKDALEYVAELFEAQPRKYKEQADA